MYNHKNHSKIFKRWCIALVVSVFAIGIIAGFIFKIEPEYSLYSTSYSSAKFNWLLAVMIWLSEIVPVAILYAVYSHLENQEVQINILKFLMDNDGSSTAQSTYSNRENPFKLSYERLAALSFDELKQIAAASGIEIPTTKQQLIGRILAVNLDAEKSVDND